jgi:hypothetical protein
VAGHRPEYVLHHMPTAMASSVPQWCPAKKARIRRQYVLSDVNRVPTSMVSGQKAGVRDGGETEVRGTWQPQWCPAKNAGMGRSCAAA